MNFTSPIFFLFLPTVLLLYRLSAKRFRLPLLLIASYLFYAYYDVRLLSLIWITTLVSYLCARWMERCATKRKKKQALALTIGTCLGILFLFKYLNFLVAGIFALLNLFGGNLSFAGFHILLPIGISFYVFQTMSYTFDVYQGKLSAEKHLGYYALFVVFFPQLVAGPIERPGDLLPQLKECPLPSPSDLGKGLQLLCRGYAKKLLIADYLSVYVDIAYSKIRTAGGAALMIATFFFAIQIYCDFSGYSDIAAGCARLMGIRLSENFHTPYLAVSIRDFWHRWHISLTRWFTDYLYIPLGGSQTGQLRHYRNILITFLVSGLWHGANLTYVIWGGLHGIYLTIEIALSRKKDLQNSRNKASILEDKKKKWVFLHRAVTFLLVCFTWIFFRAATIQDAILVIRSILFDFQFSHMLLGLGITPTQLLIAILLLLLLPSIERMPNLFRMKPSNPTTQISTVLLYFMLALTILVCRCFILTGHGSTNFIYFQF